MLRTICRNLLLPLLLFAAPLCLRAQNAGGSTAANSNEEATFPTMFPHSDTAWWWVSGQANSIVQAHGRFRSPYSGANSFVNHGETKASVVDTLFLGAQFNPARPRYNSEILFDPEETGGRGISQALGLAGFTNLDVVRNPNLGIAPYIGRAELHQTIGFTSEMTDNGRGWNSLAPKVPVRRLELRAGKVSVVDFFDINSVGSDSHSQFTNWTIDNTGSYDYAADTRGYTYGAVAEYQQPAWGARYGLFLMPTVANGINLEWNLRRARGEQVEFERRFSFIPKRKGIARALYFWNHANMGDYRQQINQFLFDPSPGQKVPEITNHPFKTTLKYGVASNFEHELTENWSVFGRFGWNEGQHESFAYTEVDQTFVLGAEYDPKFWTQKYSKIGAAVVTNAIKQDHQKYLALGGLGFLLGDGKLDYARENIVEIYWNTHLWRGLYGAVQSSYIWHPGYNQDRGPIYVPGARLHVEF